MHRDSVLILLVLCTIVQNVCNQETSVRLDPISAIAQEKKLSQYIKEILNHYKQKDPIGLPGAPIPDPLLIPPLNHSFSVGRMNFRDVKLYGLKKFRIDHVTADIAAMRVEAALTIEHLSVFGNYTLNTWLSSAKGPFTVQLTKVFVKAVASMEVERSGLLEAQAMNADITFKEIAMDFKNLGFFASMFQSVMNSVGTFVFDSIKPYILSEVNSNIRTDVNKQLRKMPQKFPNSISPFDQLVSELRKRIRIMGYDPFKVQDYNNSVGIFDIYLTHTWLYGVSSYHRTNDVVFEVRNGSVHGLLEVGTQKLLGTTHWDISLVAGLMSRVGTASFSVEYIKVSINVSQSMDTREHPSLDDIQLEIGNIQIRFDGLGTVDYVIEAAVNVVPNLIRYQIMDAIERPIKQKVQEELDRINVEQLIEDNAKKLDGGGSLQDLQFL